MKHPARYVISGTCFAVVAVLLFSFNFSDRGRRFTPPEARGKTDRAGTYDLARARLMTRVIGHVRSHYVEPARVDAREMAVAAMQAVQGAVPEVMVEVARDGKDEPTGLTVAVDQKRKEFSLGRVGDLYELNWKLMDVFDFLERHLPPSHDLEEIEYAAVNGVLSTLDPHSVLLTPRVYRDMQVGTQGRFGGLGIVISARDGLLQIMSVMGDTPAARAGLKSGDQITQIGEESTVNMPLSDAVNRLRGEPGSEVTIWIKREDLRVPKPYTLTREEIRIRSVDHEPLGAGIGYVKVRNFQSNTFDDLQEALEDLSRKPGGLKGLVLDLRDNPGGLLDQAIEISDRFLSQGTVVTTVRGGGGSREREERHATAAGTLADVPLVVLINRGAASASEIVSGALKNNDRALVIGTTSFGKGSVQVVYKLDEAALKLTVAQYLTPGDVSIQGTGIVPDIEILTMQASKDAIDLRPADLDARGEAELKASLRSKLTRVDKPSLQLALVEREAKSGGDGFTPDAEIELARDLLKAAPSTNRKEMLLKATGFLKTVAAREERELMKRLGELGIDWSDGANPKRPNVDVTLSVARPDGATGSPQAGETVQVLAKLTNKGSKPLYRMHGILRSAIAAFDGVEMAFGRVMPGASREFSVPVELPKSTTTAGDHLKLAVWAEEDEVGEMGAAPVRVRALPQPRFAYTATVADPAPKGNGDGLVQRGETLNLAVRVTNVGEGDADDVLVTIQNESGEDVYIEQGRERIGKVARGASEVGHFSLRVKDSLKARDVQLKVSIIDRGLRTWSHDDLVLQVFPGEFPAATDRTGIARVARGPVALRAGAHRDMPVVAEASKGAALEVAGAAGKWLKVRWRPAPPEPGDGKPAAPDDDAFAWVPAEQVEVVTGGQPQLAGVEPALQHVPPALEVKPASAGLWDASLITKASSVKLDGVARFTGSARGRRYVYIFRGDDKVFFRSAETATDALDFVAPIPLERGANELTIVAREGDGDVTRQRVTVFRR